MTWALEGDLGSWDPVVRALPFVLGVVLLAMAAASIVRTMVVPRANISWVYAVVLRATDGVFTGVARALRTWPSRDRVLAWSGPIGIMAALIVWLMLFLLSYALIIFGLTDSSIADSLLEAGSGLFTLGLVGTPSESVTLVSFFAAMTGPAVIALLIGFLPTLYQSYLSRESRVLLTAGFSGAPAWGPEVLARVQLLEGDSQLPEIFGSWIEWCAQVRLTQTLYPALNRFRSPVGTRNWLITLVAMLDAAAIRMAIKSGQPDPRTIAFLQQGAQVILSIDATEVGIDEAIRFHSFERRIAATLQIFGVTEHQTNAGEAPQDQDSELPPGVRAVEHAVTLDSLRGRVPVTRELLLKYQASNSTITREEFGKTLDYLRSAGVAMNRSDDDAYAVFVQIRGRYEGAAYHLAQRFYLPRAPWTGPRNPEVPVMWPSLAAEIATEGDEHRP